MEFAMLKMKIVKRNARIPRVRFSPEYMTEIEEMVIEKAYLKAHRTIHKGRNQVITVQAPKKYIDCANQFANFVMYALKLEMAIIQLKAKIEKIQNDNSMEELKRWRFIYGLFERHKLNEDKELKYMEE